MSRRLRKDAVGALVALVLVALHALVPPLAWAADANPFEVRGIAVDVTAETVDAAREQALAEGELKAFGKLIERLVDPEARSRVPELTAEQVDDFVADFAIKSEKTSNVRYIATLDVRFDAEAVREFLVESGVSFVATPSAPVVVIPVFADADSFVLWDYPNPWREAWEAREAGSVLVPTVVPEGDLADVAAVGADEAVAGDLERLRKVAERYGASEAVVSVARLLSDTRSGTSLVTVSTSRYGDDGLIWQVEQNVKGGAGEDAPAVLARTVAKVGEEIETRWKRGSTVDTGGSAELAVTVPISGIRDWVEVRRRLDDTVLVRETEIVLMSREEVRVKLRFVGDLEQLLAALKRADLALVQEEEGGIWILEPPSRDGGGDT